MTNKQYEIIKKQERKNLDKYIKSLHDANFELYNHYVIEFEQYNFNEKKIDLQLAKYKLELTK